jgi:heptosyltransferase-2
MTLDEHAVKQNLNLLKPLGICHENETTYQMKMWLTSADNAVSQQFFARHGITDDDTVIGFHPGSSNEWGMVYKRWPKKNFATLGDKIFREYPKAKILLFGGPDETELKSAIEHLMTPKPIIVSGTSLRETAALIKKCDAFISNDSGLMHVAAAMKTPTVGIFGPTNPRATAPYGNGHIVVAKDMACRPCWPILKLRKNNFKPKCEQNPSYACLSQLPISKVLDAAKTLIQKH